MIFDPRHNLELLAIQLAVEQGLPPEHTTWAVRWELDEDGTARAFPLFIRDLPLYAERVWYGGPDTMDVSVEP